MKTRVFLTLTVSAFLTASMTGCASTATVARGQNPAQEPEIQQVSHGTQPHIGEAVHDHFKNNEVLYFNNARGIPTTYPQTYNAALADAYAAQQPNGASCPPSADCPHCQGQPPAGQPCPFCQQDLGGYNGSRDVNVAPSRLLHDQVGRSGHYPDHHFTYSYHRPKNLVYPPPQVPGGSVVWPYYTLKGPSDFFRAN